MKRVKVLFLVLCMVLSLIPVTVANATDRNSVIIVEAEDCTFTGTGVKTTSKTEAFGGEVAYYRYNAANPTNWPRGTTQKISWSSDIPDNQAYDVWVLSAVTAGTGGVFNQMQLSYSGVNGTDTVYVPKTGQTGCYSTKLRTTIDVNMAWNRVYAGVSFGTGTTSFEYSKAEEGTQDYYMIDRIMIVPSAFGWTPNATTSIADFNSPSIQSSEFTADTNGDIIMEAEDGILSGSGTTRYSKGRAFGGYVVGNYNDPSDANPSIGWYADIPDNQAYDVWVLSKVAASGASGEEMNQMQLFYSSVDGTDTVNVPRSNLSGTTRYQTSMSYVTTNYMNWNRVYTGVTFGAGTAYFQYFMGEKGTNNLYIIDRIMVVPSAYNWTPSYSATAEQMDAGDTNYLLVDVPLPVSFKNYRAKYSGDSEITAGSLTSGNTVNATVSVKKTDSDSRSAMLAVGLYDSADNLVKCDISTCTLTSEFQDLTVSIVLPGTSLTGHKIRAFLWDSPTSIRAYTDSISY
ncbi:MAG: hypothetical protein K5768_10005 [Firmicutes bacterium]|nr:hypothetical protein [Bacillota bacterium]